jgi:hypothetical protein
MNLRSVLMALGILCFASAARAADPACGAHQHQVVEQNDEEGGTLKRCVCDEGWDAGGPGAPCRKAKSAQSKARPKK